MANIRLQKYKKNRLLGMNQVNAALAAGYPESTARHHSTMLEKQVKMGDVLERIGLTDKYLANKHLELIEAKEIIKIKDAQGNVLRCVDVKDYPIQAKALELAYKLKSHLKESDTSRTPSDRIVIIYHPDYKGIENRDQVTVIPNKVSRF
jgi:hypothetical protein